MPHRVRKRSTKHPGGVIASGAGPLGHVVACEEATAATMVHVTVPVGPQKMQPFGVADLKMPDSGHPVWCDWNYAGRVVLSLGVTAESEFFEIWHRTLAAGSI